MGKGIKIPFNFKQANKTVHYELTLYEIEGFISNTKTYFQRALKWVRERANQ